MAATNTITTNGTALTTAESKTLADHESTIERGLKTFYAVGNALLAIRDDRLYRQTHKTFEAYCRDRWDMGRNYVNKLITACYETKNIPTTDSVFFAISRA